MLNAGAVKQEILNTRELRMNPPEGGRDGNGPRAFGPRATGSGGQTLRLRNREAHGHGPFARRAGREQEHCSG